PLFPSGHADAGRASRSGEARCLGGCAGFARCGPGTFPPPGRSLFRPAGSAERDVAAAGRSLALPGGRKTGAGVHGGRGGLRSVPDVRSRRRPAGKSASKWLKQMETVQLSYPLDSDKTYPPAVLAIGYFDGVHRGHQSVIRRARELAARLGVASAVMTFHPHPREVLGKSKLSGYITPLPDKLRQFARLGVDRTYVMKFDRLFADRTKEQFVEAVLIPLQVKGVVVGFNFCFGRGASGRAEDLKTLGEGRFCVEVIHPVLEGEIPVSSTRLREALAAGDVVTAEKILGRPHLVEGEVVTGDRRGRTIGFPTANLALTQPYAIPKRGVYLVSVALGDRWIPGVMNIGLRPTF